MLVMCWSVNNFKLKLVVNVNDMPEGTSDHQLTRWTVNMTSSG